MVQRCCEFHINPSCLYVVGVFTTSLLFFIGFFIGIHMKKKSVLASFVEGGKKNKTPKAKSLTPKPKYMKKK